MAKYQIFLYYSNIQILINSEILVRSIKLTFCKEDMSSFVQSLHRILEINHQSSDRLYGQNKTFSFSLFLRCFSNLILIIEQA